MDNFYITFDEEGHIFKGGWIVVRATNKQEALLKMGKKYHPGKSLNELFEEYAFIYSSEIFERTKIFSEGNLGSFEQGFIG